MYITVQKTGVSNILFKKKKWMNTFIQQGRIQLIKHDSKDICNVKISISNKCCSFELSIQRILKKCISFHKV